MYLNKIATNKYVVLRPFQKKYITKEFVHCLNKKCINQFLNIRHKKQTMISAKNYFDDIDKNNDIYYAIFKKNDQCKLIGTITLRRKNKNIGVIGNMICYKKYFGTMESKTSFSLFISLIFKNTNFNKILAGTEKNNISSNFNLIYNNFKLIEKNGKYFKFLLKKNNFKQ